MACRRLSRCSAENAAQDIHEGVEAYPIGIHRLTDALGQPGNKATLIKMGDFKTWQGSNEYDADAGIWGTVNKQLDQVCAAVSNEPELADGFNAVGFSQGGLFFRALIERCSGLIVHTLVTYGSPHAGISKLPSFLGVFGTPFLY
jgi:palmitoyl-protein thioesterase